MLSENRRKIQNLDKLKKQSGKNRLTFEKDKSKTECTGTTVTYVGKGLRGQRLYRVGVILWATNEP